MKEYQVTFFATKYKPLATTVKAESITQALSKEKIVEAMKNVCRQRGWQSLSEMRKLGYEQYKVKSREKILENKKKTLDKK